MRSSATSSRATSRMLLLLVGKDLRVHAGNGGLPIAADPVDPGFSSTPTSSRQRSLKASAVRDAQANRRAPRQGARQSPLPDNYAASAALPKFVEREAATPYSIKGGSLLDSSSPAACTTSCAELRPDVRPNVGGLTSSVGGPTNGTAPVARLPSQSARGCFVGKLVHSRESQSGIRG